MFSGSNNDDPNRQGLKLALVIGIGVLVAGFAFHIFSFKNPFGGDDTSRRNADLSAQVKEDMQHQLDTDSHFGPYHLQVEKVELVNKTGNQYEGIATVRGAKGIDHSVPVEVTADGDYILWKTEPRAFAWAILEQMNTSVPTP